MSSGDFMGFDASLILGSNGGGAKILEVLQRGVEGRKVLDASLGREEKFRIINIFKSLL